MVNYYFLKEVFVKKKFTLHLDAMLALVFLFLAMLALIFFQQSQLSELTLENQKLQWQSVEDSFNLDSQANYIKKLQQKLDLESKE
jgi:Tfp pilus assembly protein PilV